MFEEGWWTLEWFRFLVYINEIMDLRNDG